MSTPPTFDDVAPIEVLLRFDMKVDPGTPGDAPGALVSLTKLLAGQPGCERCWVARSTDEPDCWVVGSRWEGVGAYRRALSNYDVKVQASSVLGSAIDEPSAFEVLLQIAGDREVWRSSDHSEPEDDRRVR